MNLIEDILSCSSVSVVGLEKNTGKTESLNWILGQLNERRICIGVTSIGIDGESVDQIYMTHKPEIELFTGTLFTTSESHYLTRRLGSEVVAMPEIHTSLGRLVVGRVAESGKVILSGPPDTTATREVIELMRDLGARTVLVDGALGRRSTASPAVTDGMVLATGAAVSANLSTLVRKTLYVCKQISLPQWRGVNFDENIRGARFLNSSTGDIMNPEIDSAVALKMIDREWFEKCDTLYVAGAVTDGIMERFTQFSKGRGFKLVIPDFTRLFVDQQVMDRFESSGGEIYVLQRPRLLAVTVNPTSPSGYTLDSDRVIEQLSAKLDCEVLNVKSKC
jgi:hypothetical protein